MTAHPGTNERPVYYYDAIPPWVYDDFKWLAVVGARKFLNPRWETIARDLIFKAYEHIDPIDRLFGITSGGAEGIDTLAENVAEEMWWRKVVYPPKIKQWEPDGFKVRNERIADTCHWMLGIRCESTKSWGTGHACQTAEDYGKIVYRYVIHEDPACEGCAVGDSWKGSCGR